MIFEKYIGIGCCLAGVRVGLLILIVIFAIRCLGFGRQHLAVCFITFFATTLGAFFRGKFIAAQSEKWQQIAENLRRAS